MKSGLKTVLKYDLFSKGNYVGSYGTKAGAEERILLDVDRERLRNPELDGEALRGHLAAWLGRKAFTVIRSTHYELAGGPRISGKERK